MHHQTAKKLARYFENPPLTDYLSIPTGEHPGVLACSIEKSPAWPAMQAVMLCMGERQAADRLRRHVARLGSEAFDKDYDERALETSLSPRLFARTEPKAPEPLKRNAKVVRFTPREFRRKMDPVAIGLTAAERADKINLYRTAARQMWNGADWDASLEIASPKIADQLLYMCERMMFNVQSSLRQTADQINALARQSMGDEIPRQQLERLEWKMAGLRVQERHYQLMEFAFKQEQALAVQSYEKGTGRSWGAYEGIKARAARSATAWRSKVRQRTSLSMVIENMNDEEYARWVDSTKRYEPKHDGTAASDEDAMNVDTVPEYDAAEGMEWSGDDEWSGDGVHRQGHDGGFIKPE